MGVNDGNARCKSYQPPQRPHNISVFNRSSMIVALTCMCRWQSFVHEITELSLGNDYYVMNYVWVVYDLTHNSLALSAD